MEQFELTMVLPNISLSKMVIIFFPGLPKKFAISNLLIGHKGGSILDKNNNSLFVNQFLKKSEYGLYRNELIIYK
jgi:hypothetical protein